MQAGQVPAGALSKPILDNLVKRGTIDASRVVELDLSAPIPNYPIVMQGNLAPELKRRIRDAFLGVQTNPIEPIRYRQMAGRAGRHGLEKLGESFLLVDDARSCERMRAVMTAEVPQLVPSLTALSKPWPWPWPWP